MNFSFTALSLSSSFSVSPFFNGKNYKEISKSHLTNFFSHFSFNSFEKISKSSFKTFLSSPIKTQKDCTTISKQDNPDISKVSGDCLVVSECVFYRCKSETEGGALSLNKKSVSIFDTTFILCQSSKTGGSIYAADPTELIIKRSCSYQSSSAEGAAFLDSNSKTQVSDCAFDASRPLQASDTSSAIHVAGSECSFKICNITQSIATAGATFSTSALAGKLTLNEVSLLQNSGSSVLSISSTTETDLSKINFIENTVFATDDGLIYALKAATITNAVIRGNTGSIVSSKSTQIVTLKDCRFDQDYQMIEGKLVFQNSQVISFPDTYAFSPAVTVWCHGASYATPKEMKNANVLIIFGYIIGVITVICGFVYLLIPVYRSCKKVDSALQ